MTFFRLDNKWLIWPLFLFMMTYVVLRALFVEPLFDELATLYWYIQTGYLPGRGATMDANNHILNSLISHQFFQLFGDHFLVYRLFALTTFPVYFFSSRKLLLKTKTPFSFLIFLALVSVHWIFDYFSFSRGYGPSLAFLMLSFCLIQNWLETFKTRYFIGVIFFFMAALLCNLSLLVPQFILMCYFLLTSISYFRNFSTKQLIGFWTSTLVFLTFLVPVYIYINKLQKAGALWWGSSDGLWEVTGKSLTRNVFFNDHETWKYLFLLLFLVLIVLFFLYWKKAGFKPFIRYVEFWIPGLFGLTLITSVLLAKVMHVNYPMDRVGMYLVPVFILSFSLLVQKQRILRWSLLLLLWFPCSFLAKLNLNTSIFSPEDRIHRSFYREMLRKIPVDATISADYVSQANYAYLSRREKIPHLVTDYLLTDSLSRGDYHISWVEEITHPGYTCLLRDPVSGTRLYRRISTEKKQLLLDTVLSIRKSSNEVIPILDFDLSSFAGELIQTQIDGRVSVNPYCLDLNLRHEILSRDKLLRRTDNTRFNWYFGRKTKYGFHYPNHPVLVLPNDQFLHICFYNDDHHEVNLTEIRVKIFRLTKS